MTGRPKKSDKVKLLANVRSCLTQQEYETVGRLARAKGETVSSLMRRLLKAEIAAAPPNKRAA